MLGWMFGHFSRFPSSLFALDFYCLYCLHCFFINSTHPYYSYLDYPTYSDPVQRSKQPLWSASGAQRSLDHGQPGDADEISHPPEQFSYLDGPKPGMRIFRFGGGFPFGRYASMWFCCGFDMLSYELKYGATDLVYFLRMWFACVFCIPSPDMYVIICLVGWLMALARYDRPCGSFTSQRFATGPVRHFFYSDGYKKPKKILPRHNSSVPMLIFVFKLCA